MDRSSSRRQFLRTAGTGAVTMWVPKPVAGYTAAELRAATVDGTVLGVGVSKWELDTPALCVDLDRLDQNIQTMKRKLTATGITSRPHAKTHKTPAIAKRQLAGGSIGVCRPR